MQLAMRGVFFGLSVLDKNVSLISGIIILGILLCIHGIANPFKGKFTNTQESFVLLNLLAVYAITLHNDGSNTLVNKDLELVMENFSNNDPNGTYRYQEFQESLIALNY